MFIFCLDLQFDQSNSNAFSNTGWNKGHLTPARVVRWSPKATRSVNLYINVAPQDDVTNKDI